MSHSPDIQGYTTQVLPDLPFELVDDIVDEACRILDVSSVSAIALTSHMFRNSANKTRFASLSPFNNAGHNVEHTAKGIRTLADVMKSGNSIESMPGVGAFATSFSLQMIGYYDEVMPVLDDGCLAYIFDNLFRPCPIYAPSIAEAIRSLSLYVYRWNRREDADYDDSRYDGLSWSSINPDLLKALKNLFRSSQVNRLSLEVMRNIPRDFLQGSGIKHLYLRRVSMGLYRTYYSQQSDEPVREEPVLLESLDIDGSVSWVDLGLIINIPAGPGPRFPRLTELSMDISYVPIFKQLNEVLNNAPVLRSLTVRLWLDNDNFTAHRDSCVINYSHLAHLKTISFLNGSGSPLPIISHLLTHDIPPILKELQITLTLRCYGTATVTKFLEEITGDIRDLDKHLVHPSFGRIHRTIISLEVELPRFDTSYWDTTLGYLEEWRTCISTKFPSLREKKDAGLEIFVTWKDR